MPHGVRWVALLATLALGLMALPILARHGFDVSVFIRAGSHYVDATKLASPIRVTPGVDGYDGQFYYRLALAPFDLRATAFGVTFDSAPWRMQRIVYPVLAWVASFGSPGSVPGAMFAINLLAFAGVAGFAVRLTRRLDLSVITPWAILLWPGFFVALTHDTTEIVASAFLLAAFDAYFAERLALYATLGVLATLTREISILVLGGILCFEIASLRRDRQHGSAWRRLLLCGLALVPFVIWREAMHLAWGQTPQDGGADNIGWPLLGAATRLRTSIAGIQLLTPAPGVNRAVSLYLAGSVVWLLAVCAAVLVRIPAVLRRPGTGVLAAAWLPVMALMSLLTASGPWISPTGYFRAFTECYIVGCLVLGTRPLPTWLRWVLIGGAGLALFGAWVLAVGER